MLTIAFVLQVVASVIAFISKVMILVGKKRGWLMGVIASVSAFAYFLLIQLYVYTTMQAGLFVLMSYGFLKGEKKNSIVETAIFTVTIGVTGAIAHFAWQGKLTTVELVSSLGLIFGTYAMTHEYKRSGWFFYGIGHLLGMYMAYQKVQPVFCLFQVLSVAVSVVGMSKKEK